MKVQAGTLSGGNLTAMGDYPEDLDEYFQQDGRWAIAVVMGFNATSILANYALFDVAILGPMNIWNMIAMATAAAVIASRRRMIQGTATIVYGLWLGIYLWAFVPGTY